MPDVYQVEPLSFGYHVRWGNVGQRGEEIAIVIIEDEDARLYRCCRCKRGSCPHAKAVIRHVIDQESG